MQQGQFWLTSKDFVCKITTENCVDLLINVIFIIYIRYPNKIWDSKKISVLFMIY